jgi:hypothetical protein
MIGFGNVPFNQRGREKRVFPRMTPELRDRIVTRLLDSDIADGPSALIILAALEGEGHLEAHLEGTAHIEKPEAPPVADTRSHEPPGAYVASITVEGFRGVGPPVTLPLRPGPGLTLVVGRNGSGKSSFAEGLEFLLTGRNYRWEKRSKVWVDGWRNLHQRDRTSLKADLFVEGQGTITVSREWEPNGDVSKAAATVRTKGGKAAALHSLGWDQALMTFRPFLSYNELGSLLDEGPSKLYDALSSVLGLEELTNVQQMIASARKERQAQVDAAKQAAEQIRTAIASVGGNDQRLATASLLLQAASWDIGAIRDLIRGAGDDNDPAIEVLCRLAAIVPPDEAVVSNAIAAIRGAQRVLDGMAGTDVQRASDLADLLDEAVRFHENHNTPDCPVCGTAAVLNPAWVDASRRQVARLKELAAAYRSAQRALAQAMSDGKRLLTSPPPALAQAVHLGLSTLSKVRKLWLTWAEGATLSKAPALADHLERHILEFAETVRQFVEEAREELKKREDIWRPIAAAITEWLPAADRALKDKTRIKELKAAEDWWKEASGAVRDERFAPIASRAHSVWNQLRLVSNVSLAGIALEGTAQRRRVSLQVTVDGTDAEALGVMSQGELHSLALSLFLPRATLPESPFRFMSIDDPVQSMDPARVEGLARTLADAARTRQVIVFTHDDRLSEAARRLGLPATIIEVTRRARSVVQVRQISDPVKSLLNDARAVALTDDLPADVGRRVVPGFCRTAIEAACMEKVRRRRLGRGATHEEVEDLLTTNARTHPLMALALFDDVKRTEDVLPRLKKLGAWAVEVFNWCKAGAHTSQGGDLKELIDTAERLAIKIAEVA